MRERVARLEQAIMEAVKLASPALQQVINDLQPQKQPHRFGGVDTVTPYQTNALIEGPLVRVPGGLWATRKITPTADRTCR
jgi:hypothetical protein